MTDLLKRWAELEPERCVRRPAGTLGPFFSTGHTAIPERSQDLDDEVKALLQFDVQQAIEAHEMEATMQMRQTPSGPSYYFEVFSQEVLPGGIPRKWGGGSDNVPCKALLTAYLQAIEATAEVDHE